MTVDKKVEQMIYHGFREININEEEYNKLKQETKNLIKLNNIKVNIIKVYAKIGIKITENDYKMLKIKFLEVCE